jgi:hypothetical protein
MGVRLACRAMRISLGDRERSLTGLGWLVDDMRRPSDRLYQQK